MPKRLATYSNTSEIQARGKLHADLDGNMASGIGQIEPNLDEGRGEWYIFAEGLGRLGKTTFCSRVFHNIPHRRVMVTSAFYFGKKPRVMWFRQSAMVAPNTIVRVSIPPCRPHCGTNCHVVGMRKR